MANIDRLVDEVLGENTVPYLAGRMHKLCVMIEELPASEQQTKVSVFASHLQSLVAKQEQELAAARRTVEQFVAFGETISRVCGRQKGLAG